MKRLLRALRAINRWLVRSLEEGGSLTWNPDTDTRPNRPRRRK